MRKGEGPEYIIRPFREEDLASVLNINRSCLPENYTPDFFVYHFREFPQGFWVAELEGEVVGYVMTRIDRGFSHRPHAGGACWKGHVISLAVMPHARRRGIAEGMLRKAIEAIRSRDVKEVYLEVRVSNDPAINLYKKLGFKVARRVPRYYGDGEDAYIMLLSLD
ncbi:MAG: ribosomal protein S18-alanine N-acetyltransferase [Candidatus Nezhaarchaeota archaeon]|nr:ribosomal protein S18-alanine N-acetyltransferase [Candidatus Nezhaarchaeota archaeon]